MNELKEKILHVLKVIFLVITFPIWGPWKLLFVRKPGQKFKEVDRQTQINRLIRSPLTKTFKFAIFIAIILLEILIVHKIRYSAVTYPFTKNAVVDYYLNERRIELDGYEGDYKNDFETAFSFIDTWSLDEKNKMNVILNSDFMKNILKYVDNPTISYIINKFNTNEEFRENVRLFIKNINSNITRFIEEIPENDFNRLNNFLNPIITISSWAIDYASTLEIGDAVFKYEVNNYNIKEKSLHVDDYKIEKGIKSGIDYNNGKTLNEITNYWS